MRIRVLGAHNCETRSTRLVTLLIDDILALDAGGLTSTLTVKAQKKLKGILLTHPHYDHIRDIPALGMNALLHEFTVSVYSTQAVHDVLATHLLNGKVYAEFLKKPEGNPVIKFNIVEPLKKVTINGYDVLPVPVVHSVPAVGYEVTSPDGKKIFYAGDTGPGLAECWQHIAPQVIFTETTAPDHYTDFARKALHLTPSLLKQELVAFKKQKGYLPQVVLVHMNPNPDQKNPLAEQVAALAAELKASISLAYEGMRIVV